MHLDHVSYVASHDQISDVVQRIGSQIGTAFVDGGIHPQFGTRNFTAPLLGGKYVEIVCALDHPSLENTAFGKAVARKANDGGGWLTWVFSTDEIAKFEQALGRPAIAGHRRRPDGSDLNWKQVGVRELLSDFGAPFFIEWISGEHPSKDGKPTVSISEILINMDESQIKSKLGTEITRSLTEEIDVVWKNVDSDFPGIEAVIFYDGQRKIRIE
jgi:Glyoxalase-like domain